jgi:hypothetical protein
VQEYARSPAYRAYCPGLPARSDFGEGQGLSLEGRHPFAQAHETRILNFSDRISGNEPELYVRRDAFEQSAEDIRNIISEHIEYLRGVRYPHDFLRHASWVVEGSPVLERFDQALIHYVIGNVLHATKVLRALDNEVDQWDAARQQYIGPLLKQIVREIDKDPARLAALLSEWEQQNVERLGLLPSRVPQDGPRLVISNQRA